jgi:hypothetical protein
MLLTSLRDKFYDSEIFLAVFNKLTHSLKILLYFNALAPGVQSGILHFSVVDTHLEFLET